MRIGIDAGSASGASTGIGCYTRNLIEYVEKTGEAEFLRFLPGKDDLNTIERIKWENFGLPAKVKKEEIDLLHVPGFAGPLLKGRNKTVTTVHDLIGMIYPDNLGKISRFYWQRWLPGCVKNSDMIIADSENTKRDIINLLGVSSEKIEVILLAADERFKPIIDTEALGAVREKYELPDEFILGVGTIEPRKNLISLIEAYSEHLNENKTGIKLVLVGKKAWGMSSVEKRAKELGVEDDVIFTGYIDDEDLPSIYNLAEFFVYPSHYEGFGLPVLEALSCGTPVITSNVSSLPEVAGEAAVYVSPDDVRGLKGSLLELEENKALREELSGKALERAKLFSWKDTAQKTLDVYRKTLSK